MHPGGSEGSTDIGIFFSYSRKNTDVAMGLREALLAQGNRVWMDTEGIEPTQQWLDVLQKAILDNPVFLFLLSPASANSEICKLELETAIRLGRRIIILELEKCSANPISSLLDNAPAEQWAYTHGAAQTAQRLGYLIKAESDTLHAWQNLVSAAWDWEHADRAEQLLQHSAALQESLNWRDTLHETSRLQSPLVDAYLEHSQQAEDTRLSTEQRTQQIRGISYIATLVVAILLFFFSQRINNTSIEAFENAQYQKYNAADMVSYILGDIGDAFQTGGQFGAMSDTLERVEGYFANLPVEDFDEYDFDYYSRLGHLLGEIKINRGQYEDALRLLEANLKIDEFACDLYPDNYDLKMNLAFTVFWTGEAKHHSGGLLSAEKEALRFYKITKKHRHISDDWEYEYTNGVYNMLWYYLESRKLDLAKNFYEEILTYYNEILKPTQDQEALMLDAIWLVSRYDLYVTNYREVIERISANSFTWHEGQYYFNRTLSALDVVKGDALLSLGNLSEALDAYLLSLKHFEHLINLDSSTTFESNRILEVLYRVLLIHRISGENRQFLSVEEYLKKFSKFDTLESTYDRQGFLLYQTALLQISIAKQQIISNKLRYVTAQISLSEIEDSQQLHDIKHISEYYFQAFYYSHQIGDTKSADAAYEGLKSLVEVLELAAYTARPLTLYVRASELVGIEDIEIDKIRKFLFQNGYWDSIVDVLER